MVRYGIHIGKAAAWNLDQYNNSRWENTAKISKNWHETLQICKKLYVYIMTVRKLQLRKHGTRANDDLACLDICKL